MPAKSETAGFRKKYEVTPEQRRKAFAALLSYAKPHRRAFLAVFGCAFLAISADLLQPFLIKYAIDQKVLFGAHGPSILLGLALAYLVLEAVSGVFSYWQANLLQRAGQSIVALLRKDLFKHITGQSMSFFDRTSAGGLVTNESSDTETINQFFTQVLLSLVRDGLSLILVVVFMFALDVRLALYCLILFPVITAIAIAFRKILRTSYQRARSLLSRLIAFTAENLSGMSLIQSFHQEKEQESRFSERNTVYLQANLREVRATVLFNRSFDILGNLSVAFVVWMGGFAVLGHRIEFGVLYAFISYIRQFFQPINQITQQWNTLQSTIVSVDRLWRIFAAEPEVKDPASEATKPVPVDAVRGRVDFNRIRFSYTDGQEVLHGLDLHVREGEFIGIVGTTGAGKSSLVNLLTRFYDVNEGSVEIDGTDIRRLPQESLHRIVGLVQQDPFLFSGSIIDNVRLFREDISREEVVRACRRIGAGPMIARLKDGYDTRLSNRGSGLSAGERQLISFARILAFRPKILILDEATANLDSHTEQLIQNALNVVSTGRTTLVIAHRLSTVQHADRILVIRDGRIAEQGTHDALLAQGGYYAELVRHSRADRSELRGLAERR
ncbi:ABC transporter ATP-binding protein [Paenibacillus macerans]|uniref:ABC transporter ATP-binding protein n=1 Tax=Paenibacillus macerans TaxID=44252 RepID=UPI003D3136C6